MTVGEGVDVAVPAGGDDAVTEAVHPSVVALRERFGDAVLRHEVQSRDEHVVFVEPSRALEILRWLHEDESQRYDLLLDVTAVDFGGGRPLQVVYQLCSIPYRRVLRVKLEVSPDSPEVDSVTHVWASANWLEREVYDLFGVHFVGHPDLRRILMPENYAEGHPLRKDFPLRGRFTRAEQTRRALDFSLEDYYSPAVLAAAGYVPGTGDRATVGRLPEGEAAGTLEGGETDAGDAAVTGGEGRS